jgi:Amt family ammonium transporter
MVFTWIKYGKPDVSMCLNASLAGLVGITAGCDVMNATGAIVVGAVSGLLVCFGVWLLDHVLHIDDPVGAVAVHGFNGLWGIIAVGLLATPDAPLSTCTGLFYGGGFSLLGSQLLGLLAIAAWTAVTITITFFIIKKTLGLRASAEEEIIGLDATEHNLPSAYADFMPSASTVALDTETASVAGVDLPEPQLVVKSASDGTPKLSKVVVICKQEKLAVLQASLNKIGVNGMTVTQVQGYGTQKGNAQYYRGVRVDGPKLLPKVKVEVVVTKIPVETIVHVCKKVLYTGQIGDGKIFVYDVEDAIKVRTGETGYDALQGDD